MKIISRFVLVFLCVSFLYGCKSIGRLHSNYSRPDIDTEGIIRSEYISSGTDTMFGWRQMFKDYMLVALIEDGLENNADVNIARLNVEVAKAELTASKLAFTPSLNAMATGSLSSYDGSKPTKTYTLGAESSWELDIFGKLSSEKKIASATVEEKAAYEQAVRSQIIATIAADYMLLMMYDSQIEITEETIVSWEEYIKTQRALMNVGSANIADVYQAEASMLNTKASLESLLLQRIKLENSLCALLGKGCDGGIRRGKLENQELPTKFINGVSVKYLINRPDVRSAESKLKQAYYTENKAYSSFYPSLNLSGSAGWTNSGGIGVTNPGAWLLQAAGSLVQPIFNKGQNRSNLKIAQAKAEQALISWKQSVIDAGREVNDALATWQSAKLTEEFDMQQEEKLEKTLSNMELLMKHGTVNYLQVVIARQSLLNAQLNLKHDIYNQLQSIIYFYQALGGC
ncbi:MAG: efflux transporter outer membrane subunit [Muribaculaceae bacterium]